MIERIHTLALANHPELIHPFTALKPMPSDQMSPKSNVLILWRFDISLRSSASQELFDLLTKLTGNGLTQLIAVRLRPSTLPDTLGTSGGPDPQEMRTRCWR